MSHVRINPNLLNQLIKCFFDLLGSCFSNSPNWNMQWILECFVILISMAWPKDSWIEINLTFFDFLEIRTRPNSYLIIQLIFRGILTSINRGCLSKFGTLSDPPPPFFLLFSSDFSIPLTLKTF